MTAMQARVSLIIIQVIFYSGFAAPIVMAAFWRWWHSELGWSIVAEKVALSFALTGVMLAYWFGPIVFARSAFMQWFTLVMLAIVPVALWWRVWVIFKAQRDGARLNR